VRSRKLAVRGRQRQFQLNFVVDGHTTVPNPRNRRLQTPCHVDRAVVDGRDPEPTPLVKRDRGDIIVRGDEPEPTTVRCACSMVYRLEQGCPNPLTLYERIERHDLALVASHVKRQQPQGHALTDSQETWQLVGMVHVPTRDDDCGTPVCLEHVADPVTVVVV
jgi:hypothetical protein